LLLVMLFCWCCCLVHDEPLFVVLLLIMLMMSVDCIEVYIHIRAGPWETSCLKLNEEAHGPHC
jgi:hypothetical protein